MRGLSLLFDHRGFADSHGVNDASSENMTAKGCNLKPPDVK